MSRWAWIKAVSGCWLSTGERRAGGFFFERAVWLLFVLVFRESGHRILDQRRTLNASHAAQPLARARTSGPSNNTAEGPAWAGIEIAPLDAQLEQPRRDGSPIACELPFELPSRA